MAVVLAMASGLSGCVALGASVAPVGRAVEVRRADTPFTYADGAEARRLADVQCGGRVRTSIYDRFEDATGAWVYPGGCA